MDVHVAADPELPAGLRLRLPVRLDAAEGLGLAVGARLAVDLGVPQRVVARIFQRVFDVWISTGSGASLRTRVAAYYEETKLKLLEKITAGHLVQADETKARKVGGGAPFTARRAGCTAA